MKQQEDSLHSSSSSGNNTTTDQQEEEEEFWPLLDIQCTRVEELLFRTSIEPV